MLVSDLIEELQKVLQDEGDIEVSYLHDSEDYDIYVVRVETSKNGNYVQLY
jgi:hypothetical protein